MKKKPFTLSVLFTVLTVTACLFFFLPIKKGYSVGTESDEKAERILSYHYPSSASKDTSHSFVKIPKITKFYKQDDLEKLPKLDLIRIYKSRLRYLIEVLPFIALHPEPGSTFHDMSIPETETNIAHLEKEAKNKADFVVSLEETLDDVIPYAEKSNIIWSILFYDEMIKNSDYVKSKK